MKFLIYDFEVFLHDWLVVFKVDGNHIVFVNDYSGIKNFYEEHKKDVFVGYNNKHYDDYILKGILSELNPKAINDWIIVQEKNGYDFPGIMKDIRFVSVDLMDDISGAIGISLKEIESNLGMSIEESSVSFDIDRKLTKEEIEETIRYCKHDVDATERLFEVRGDYIRSKLQIINKFKLPLNDLRMTNAQLTAEVMKARKKSHDDSAIYDKPKCVGLKNIKILDFFKNPQDGTRKLNMDIIGVPHTIGYGGLHGALKQAHFKGDLYNFDVSLVIWAN